MRTPLPSRRRPGDWCLATLALCGLLAWTAGHLLGPSIACETTRSEVLSAPAASVASDDRGLQGLDLQVRVGRLRVEFPWMRALPIAPGRRIIISIEPWSGPG
jgi:hypothetical protein